ncbi:MAG TPA: YciI family protein [Burkholderiales bacterium]|nr:YciI family protein [Burkholderiales bacterium]
MLPTLITALWVFPLRFGIAQEPPSSQSTKQYEMTTYQLCLMLATSKWNMPDFERLHEGHVAHLKSLLGESGRALIAGPFLDEGKYRGALVLDAGSLDAARVLAEQDPIVKEGLVTLEVHPWYAAKGIMKKSTALDSMPTYQFGMLLRGPSWAPGESPELKALQEQHMAHIRKTAESGKLVIAGPLGDGGNMRGILVYKVATLEEARALAEADPAVKAGRLKVELHPWMVPRGSLP